MSALQTVEQDKKLGGPHRFSSTNQPVKNGRPAAHKDRLTSTFLKAFADDFEANGAEAIAKVRETEPAQYLRVAASLVPKEIAVTRRLEDTDDDKLQAAIDLILQMRRPDDAKEIEAVVSLND